jgi:ribosome-associated protein
MEEININTEYIKLDQLLKFVNAVEGGGMAKRAITDGLVKVNGEVVLQRGKKLRQGDMIEYNNEKYIIKGPPAENVSNQKEEE